MSDMTSSKALHILGLSNKATQKDIRAAWRRLVFEMHPDRGVGTDADLAKINAAYAFMRELPARETDERRDAPGPKSPARRRSTGPSSPRGRPEVKTKLETVSTEAKDICEALFENRDVATSLERPIGSQPEDINVDDGHKHVPGIIRRTGRRLSFLVDANLEEGENAVSLPTGNLSDGRKVNPKVVTFSAFKRGPGQIEVSEEMRKDLFPGARSVKIHFADVS